jgi:xanthine/uracil permease
MSSETILNFGCQVQYLESWGIIVCAIAAFLLNILALILNITLVRNRRLHIFPPAIIGMAATALALASVAFKVLALDGVQTSKDDPKGKRKNK